MQESKVEVVDINDLIPDDKNFNKGNEQGQELMERSFREHVAGRSILLDKNGRVIAGNKSQKAAIAAGIKRVFVVYPFVPVINVVGFVFLLLMMSTAEKRQDMYLRGRFFEDVKRKEKSEEGAQ